MLDARGARIKRIRNVPRVACVDQQWQVLRLGLFGDRLQQRGVKPRIGPTRPASFEDRFDAVAASLFEGAHLLPRFLSGLRNPHHLLARLRPEEFGHVLDVLGPVAALRRKHGTTSEQLRA